MYCSFCSFVITSGNLREVCLISRVCRYLRPPIEFGRQVNSVHSRREINFRRGSRFPICSRSPLVTPTASSRSSTRSSLILILLEMKNGIHFPKTVKDRSREKSMLSNTVLSLSQLLLMVRCCPVRCEFRLQHPSSAKTRLSSIGREMMYSWKKPLI